MKRLIILTGIAMFLSLEVSSQEIKNKMINRSNWEDLQTSSPVTDTLAFELPNEGTLLLLFNSNDYDINQLEERFTEVLKETTDFPEFTTLVYRLSEEYPLTEQESVILDLERNYLPYLDKLELGLVLGMDYTGGEFTPQIGAKVFFNFRKFDLGVSFTNTIYFPERIENNIRVNSNWFTNLEYRWDRSDPKSNSANSFGSGILVNSNKSELFQGTTMQAYYRREINTNFSLQVGVIGTENLKTFYPTIGLRFWY